MFQTPCTGTRARLVWEDCLLPVHLNQTKALRAENLICSSQNFGLIAYQVVDMTAFKYIMIISKDLWLVFLLPDLHG